MVHSDAIWNDILERQIHFWKQFLSRAIVHYLKRFLTSVKKRKTGSLKHAFWRYLKGFVTSVGGNENKVYIARILTVFETICNFSGKQWKQLFCHKFCLV